MTTIAPLAPLNHPSAAGAAPAFRSPAARATTPPAFTEFADG